MSNLKMIGERAWSYGTALRDVLPDGRTIGNTTRYSVTTSNHQAKTRVRGCDVQVTDVPRGTDNLAAWYLARQPKEDAPKPLGALHIEGRRWLAASSERSHRCRRLRPAARPWHRQPDQDHPAQRLWPDGGLTDDFGVCKRDQHGIRK